MSSAAWSRLAAGASSALNEPGILLTSTSFSGHGSEEPGSSRPFPLAVRPALTGAGRTRVPCRPTSGGGGPARRPGSAQGRAGRRRRRSPPRRRSSAGGGTSAPPPPPAGGGPRGTGGSPGPGRRRRSTARAPRAGPGRPGRAGGAYSGCAVTSGEPGNRKAASAASLSQVATRRSYRRDRRFTQDLQPLPQREPVADDRRPAPCCRCRSRPCRDRKGPPPPQRRDVRPTVGSRPRSRARRTAWFRRLTPSLRRMLRMWVRTVFTEMNMVAAISAVDSISAR